MCNMILGIMFPIVFTFAAIFFGFWRAKAAESSGYYDQLTRWNSDHEADIERLKEQYDTDLEFYKKLAHNAMDRANRNGAIAEGLAEDLAALKAYDPEEIEERLKKIREIRAAEEKTTLEDKLRETIAWSMLNAQLNVISQYKPPSPTLEQTVCAQSFQNPWGLY